MTQPTKRQLEALKKMGITPPPTTRSGCHAVFEYINKADIHPKSTRIERIFILKAYSKKWTGKTVMGRWHGQGKVHFIRPAHPAEIEGLSGKICCYHYKTKGHFMASVKWEKGFFSFVSLNTLKLVER